VQLAWRDITKGGKKASEEAGETTAASAFQLKNKMKLAEARQVLDVEEDATLSQIRKVFFLAFCLVFLYLPLVVC